MKKKIIVLVVLAGIAAWTWLPKFNLLKSIGKDKPKAKYGGFFEPMPAKKKNKKRTDYKDWGKNPFSVSKAASASAVGSQGARLGGIIYDANDVCALINDELVHRGDSVGGKKVVEIHRDRVILNDGTKDIELRLEE